jgi:hypothetical protein
MSSDIVPVRENDEKLRESEDQYRSLFENSMDGILLTAPDGSIFAANPAACRMLGRTQEEICAVGRGGVVDPADPRLSAFLEERTRIGKFSGELTHMRKDGTRFPAEVTTSIFKDRDGRERTCLIFRDITDRKRAEKNLRESEERYRSLFDRMLDGVYRSTHEGRFVDVNAAFVKMFGYSSKQEMLDITDIRKELYFSLEERGSHILDTGQEEVEVYRMRRKDGSEIWVEDHGRYVHDGQGNIIFHEGTVRDVTERKRMEEEIRGLARFPSENPNPVLRLNKDGTIIIANPASKLLLREWGSEGGGVAPKFWRDLTADALSTRQDKNVDVEFGGRSYTFLVKPTVESDCVNLYGRDITERKRMERELKQSEERYRLITENMPGSVWLTDMNLKPTYLSPNNTRIRGYTLEELYALPLDRQLAPDSLKLALENFKKALSRQNLNSKDAPRTPVIEELEWYRKDGSTFWSENTFSFIRNSKGEPIGILGVGRDITEEKRAQEALRASEEKYRAMVENSPDLIGIFQDGVLKYVNSTAILKLGWTYEELVSPAFDPIENVVSKKSRDLLKENVGKNLRDEDVAPYEISLTGKDGSEILVLATGAKIIYNQKPAIEFVFDDITERKRAEKEHAKYEARLQTLHTHARQLSSANNIDTIVKYTIDAMELTLGFEYADFMLVDNDALTIKASRGGPVAFSMEPLDGRGVSVKSAKAKETLRIADTRKEPAYVDPKGFDWTGPPTYLSELVTPVFTDGEAVAVLCVDNTRLDHFTADDQRLLETLASHVGSAIGRLRHEEELRRYSENLEQLVSERTKKLADSEGRLRLVADSLPVLIAYVDTELRYKFNNKTYEEWFGHAPSGIAGQHVRDFLGGPAYQAIRSYVETALSGKRVSFETEMKYKEGRTRYVDATFVPDLGELGEVRGIFALVNDITQRKRVEDALRESESRYRRLFESSPIPLWEEDFSSVKKYFDELRERGVRNFRTHFMEHPEDVARCARLVKILDANQTAMTLFGAESVRDFVGDLSRFLTKEAHDVFREEFVALAEGKVEFDSDYAAQTLTGDAKQISLRVGVVSGYEDTLNRVLVSAIDLTEYKLMEERVLRSERLATIGELAAMVAHDLRNPLQGITGTIYNLKRHLSRRIDGETKEALEVIEHDIEYSEKILTELFEYSREIHLDLKETNPRSITKDALARVKIPARIRVVDSTRIQPRIVVDIDKMNRVFVNLITNAVDAMPRGGTLRIGSKKTDTNLEVTFTDTGTGIAKENIDKLWSPLFTTKARGIGFGLSIVERLVEAHGGSVTVESRIGRGSTFTVTLPIKQRMDGGQRKK